MSSTATVYAPGVRPSDYRDYMWLLTAGDKVECVVDGAPPGPNGRLFIVEPGKAKKVPWEAGRFILNHLAYTGVVRVNEIDREDGTGTDLDIDGARAESLANFAEGDARRWRDYVQYVIDDKIGNKKVVPPMPESIVAIAKRRGYRLSDHVNANELLSKDRDDETKTLQKMVKELMTKNEELTAQVRELIGEPDPTPAKRKG